MTPQSISPQPPTANAQLRDRLYTIAEGLTHPDARKIAATLGRMKDENQAEFERLKTNGRQLVSLIKHRREELLVAFHALEDATQRTRETYRLQMERITKASNDYRKQTRMVRTLLPLELRERLSESRNGHLVTSNAHDLQPVKLANRPANEMQFVQLQLQCIARTSQEANKFLVQQVTTYHSALQSTFGTIDSNSTNLPPHLTETMTSFTQKDWQQMVGPPLPPGHRNDGWFGLCRSVMIGAVTGGWTGQHLLLSIPLISEAAAWVGSLIGAWVGYQIFRKEMQEAAARDIREAGAELVRRINARTTFLMACTNDRWDAYTLELEARLKQAATVEVKKNLQANRSKLASLKKEMKQLEQAARELNHLGRLVASPKIRVVPPMGNR
ncbi:MAG TPA: hypothetical protein PLS70_13840 [Acidobacteriota bacterium]|nr:hypothetical protein [Acidobacteriota bacterium]